jgi:hypothetical protein
VKSLVNRSALREFLLQSAQHRKLANGDARFQRVSSACYAGAEAELRQWARAKAHSAPSKGRTIL